MYNLSFCLVLSIETYSDLVSYIITHQEDYSIRN